MGYAEEVLADNPLGYWRFNDVGGTAAIDSSPNARDMTYGLNASRSAYSLLDVPGDTSVGLMPTVSGPMASLSAAGWMNISSFTVEAIIKPRPEVANAFATIFARYNVGNPENMAFSLRLDNLRPYFYRGVAGNYTEIHGTNQLTPGQTYHIAASYDGTTARLYVDGTLVAFANQGVGYTPAAVPMTVGSPVQENDERFWGWIDEVAYYAGALDGARIAAHHTARVDVYYRDLIADDEPIAYWNQNDFNNTVMADYMGNHPGEFMGPSYIQLGAFPLLHSTGGTSILYDTPGRGYVADAAWMDLNVFSVETWMDVTFPNLGSLRTVVARYGQPGGTSSWRIYIEGGIVKATLNRTSGEVTLVGDAITEGVHHFVLTASPTEANLYIDGEVSETKALTGTQAASDNPLTIGANAVGGDGVSTARIDEVSFFDKALSAENVAAHYEGRPFSVAPLEQLMVDNEVQMWWRFDDSATPIQDHSGNDRDSSETGGSFTLGQPSLLAGAPTHTSVTTPGGMLISRVYDTWMNPAQMTIMGWVRLDATGGTQTIVARNRGNSSWVLRFDGTEARFYMRYNDNWYYVSKAGMTTGQVYHVVGTHNGTVGRIYVNGVAGTPLTTGIKLDGTDRIDVGSYFSGTDALIGDVQDIAFFGTALNQVQIQEFYTSSITTPTATANVGAYVGSVPVLGMRVGATEIKSLSRG